MLFPTMRNAPVIKNRGILHCWLKKQSKENNVKLMKIHMYYITALSFCVSITMHNIPRYWRTKGCESRREKCVSASYLCHALYHKTLWFSRHRNTSLCLLILAMQNAISALVFTFVICAYIFCAICNQCT